MVVVLKKIQVPLTDKNPIIKIDKLFENETGTKMVNDKAKLLELPSGIVKIGNKSRRRRRTRNKKSFKIIKSDEKVLFNELIGKSESLEAYNPECEGINISSEYGTEFSSENSADSNNNGGALNISETTNFELNEIYEAIDSINKICIDPIKVKIKKDYVKAKNTVTLIENSDDIRYRADINIVLSSRKEATSETIYTSIGKDASDAKDFSLVVENITDTSESLTPLGSFGCCNIFDFKKINSNITKDSVRTLDNVTTPSKTSDQESKSSNLTSIHENQSNLYDNDRCSVYDNSINRNKESMHENYQAIKAVCDVDSEQISAIDGKSSVNAGSSYDDSREHRESSEALDYNEQKPYYGRTLFYRYHNHGPNSYTHSNSTVSYPFPMRDPGCMSPYRLGFDSEESFNNSLNAASEIIIKPPVTIGRSISFRSNVNKCVLAEDKFITNSVFQINWFNPRPVRRKRSILNC